MRDRERADREKDGEQEEGDRCRSSVTMLGRDWRMAQWDTYMTSLLLENPWQCLQPCVHGLLPQQIQMPLAPCPFSHCTAVRQHCPCREHSQVAFLVPPSVFLTAFLHPKHTWKGPLKDRHYVVLRTPLPIKLFPRYFGTSNLTPKECPFPGGSESHM